MPRYRRARNAAGGVRLANPTAAECEVHDDDHGVLPVGERLAVGEQLVVAELVGTDGARILSRSVEVLDGDTPQGSRPNPYGDGRAGERIADIVAADLL